MTEDDPRHGTTAGYQAHAKEGETPCRACKDARNDRRRRERTCATCSRKTKADAGICRICASRRPRIPTETWVESDELTGGQWVPRDGIMRWEPAA